MTTHTMFDGRLQVYRRADGKTWQCAARVGGERFRESTHETELARAKDVAEEWYLGLRGQLRNGQIVKKEKTFGEAAEDYMRHFRVLAAGLRSPAYIEGMDLRLKVHVDPFFSKTALPEVNRGLVMSYRVKRAEDTIAKTLEQSLRRIDRDEKNGMAAASSEQEILQVVAECAERRRTAQGKPPARSTIDHEMVLIRQVLKHAEGKGWLTHLPNLEMPYKTQTKRQRRAWFSPDEYKQLYTATGRKAGGASGGRVGWQEHYQELHDLVLFMANTGLRPDEAFRLEFRDVAIEDDYSTKQTILVIDVRGKTGTGYCKSMPGAVHPFTRILERRTRQLQSPPKAWPKRSKLGKLVEHRVAPIPQEPRALKPTDRLFNPYDRDAFNAILREEGLKHDRDGQVRPLYSLRHTYISMRLMEGADVYQIANNCRTSVQMIEQFYAAHIKDRIDAASINMQRPIAARKSSRRRTPSIPDGPDTHAPG
ncbi:site-specific integrase [Brevundimonas sp.]|uniref:site-specific integrase n=1 Tax=Brevundimonas sp. TaxID=1871086 RepID=UPI003BA94900